MTATQQSKLLADLFEQVDPEQRLTVLHIGAALPETVDFFSGYRCKLYFVDLFGELPLVEPEEEGPTVAQQLATLLQFSPDTRFDICLFWDLFNYLGSEAIRALATLLAPYLQSGTRGHGFAVRNPRTPQDHHRYGIRSQREVSVRQGSALPGYAPHGQSQLQSLLSCFTFDRSVLLSDGRLELQLSARL